MTRLLFLDRDGTLIEEPQPDQQVDSLDKLIFRPGAISTLARLVRHTDFELVLVTNQDGLGTAAFPEETFWPAHRMMLRVLESEGVRFRTQHIDRSLKHENLPTRKPGTAMLQEYLTGGFDLARSYVVGDRLTDVELARRLGAQAIFLKNASGMAAEAQPGLRLRHAEGIEYDPAGLLPHIALVAESWSEIGQFLLAASPAPQAGGALEHV
ncbi:MAG TPA: histidinol-phosphatase [Saprospiraceae bacterium]|nr:histidinol-phosphatase [Saprospiraceae bacterium]